GTVRHEVLLVIIEFDIRLLAEALENVSSRIGRYRWRFDVVLNADLDQRAVGAHLFDLRVGVSTMIQFVHHLLRSLGDETKETPASSRSVHPTPSDTSVADGSPG